MVGGVTLAGGGGVVGSFGMYVQPSLVLSCQSKC